MTQLKEDYLVIASGARQSPAGNTAIEGITALPVAAVSCVFCTITRKFFPMRRIIDSGHCMQEMTMKIFQRT
jgi:hypothetical protein